MAAVRNGRRQRRRRDADAHRGRLADRLERRSQATVKRLLVTVLLAVTAGCGTNKPEIPPELLETPGGGDCSSADYPAGPYGKIAGKIAGNACFQGWRDPTAA